MHVYMTLGDLYKLKVHENKENGKCYQKCCHLNKIWGHQNWRLPVGTGELTAVDHFLFPVIFPSARLFLES